MEDNPPANESNESGLNKIDLTQLQSFTFGTQWTEIKPVAPGRREPGERGPMRERRDDGFGRPGEPRRDRRSFRRPPPGPGQAGGPPGEAGAGAGGEPHRRDDRPRFSGGRGGPPQGERREGGPPFERAPYVSPYFNITCYPEDAGFAALVKAVRASCRTFQLFEIAKAILEKNDRFVVVLARRRPEVERPAFAERPAAGDRTAPGAPADTGETPAPSPTSTESPEAPAAERRPEPARPGPLFLSVPDGLPFDTEEAAIQHVMKSHLGVFFTTQEVEIDPPKGNFPIINRCTITGELLGPPNYHLYQQIIQKHHATRLNRMPFDRFRERIESVRDPEVVSQWLEKMKKATRFTWAFGAKPAVAAHAPSGEGESVSAPATAAAAAAPAQSEPAAVVEAPPPASAPEDATPAEATVPADVPAAAAPATGAPAFDSYEEARAYLLSHARDKVVRPVETARFHGRLIEKLSPGEIRRAVEGHAERQRRFPLDTANALRGRLRREGFTIFKKGSRGVSYVCAVKRRFRVPGQVFSDSITALIDFIEKHPLIHRRDLAKEYLGIDVAAAIAAAPLPEGTPLSQAPFAVLPTEEANRLRRMNNDLRWLVIEGYVTEFSDGRLFAPPPMMPQTQKKADEHGEEHDPEDFPEAPAAPTPAPEAALAPAPAAEAAPGATKAPAAAEPAAAAAAAPAAPMASPAPEPAAGAPAAVEPPPAEKPEPSTSTEAPAGELPPAPEAVVEPPPVPEAARTPQPAEAPPPAGVPEPPPAGNPPAREGV